MKENVSGCFFSEHSVVMLHWARHDCSAFANSAELLLFALSMNLWLVAVYCLRFNVH